MLILLFTFTFVFADEPPSWREYKKVSDNLDFFAWVHFADNDTIKYPWERKWQLSVFDKDSILFWKREVNPSGYVDGYITDDGRHFITIDEWYYPKKNVVRIFNANHNDFFIKGEEFKIPEIFLRETVSHQLWIEKYQIVNHQLFIETVDRTKWIIDIGTNTFKKEQFLPLNELIIITILVIVILMIVTFKKRSKL